MPFYDVTWYCNAGDQSTTGYYAVAKWAAAATIAAGALRRQLAVPTVGNERVFICIVAGTTGGAEPPWTLTRGAKTTDNTVTWQECTGASAVNGDLIDTPTWTAAKAIGNPTLGAIIKRGNGASYWICSTAGTLGASEPAWANDTAGTTQVDSTTTWTCLGVVGNFTGGQAPHARLANALAASWAVAGNTVFVGDNHAESQAAAMSISVPGNTAGAILKVLCHNHSGPYPPTSLTTGAVVTVSTANGLTIGGPGYFYGLTFKSGANTSVAGAYTTIQGNTLANQSWTYFDSCSFQILSTGTALLNFGFANIASVVSVIWNNVTVYFGSTNCYLWLTATRLIWQNTGPVLASGSSVPATLFSQNTNSGPLDDIVLEALDLSQLTGSLFNNSVPTLGNLLIKDCKLNALATIGTPTHTGQNNQLVRCDSGATAYKSARYAYEGTETTETSITRVSGASDPTGQAQSRKIVTTANSQWLRPYKAEPYAIWNPTTGANVTVTVYGTINAGALPNNDDIWLEVEYLSASGSPLGTIVNTTKSNLLAANAAVASDGSTWNGGGSGAGWTPFKLTTTLSSPQPGLPGYIEARVRVAKPSATFYLDPKIMLS